MFRLHCAAFRSDLLLHWLAGSSVASTGTSFHLFPFVSVQSWCAEMVHRSLPNMLLCVFLLFCLAGSSVASTGTSFHLFPFISICFRLFPCIRGVLRFCTDCFGTYCYLFFPLLHCVVSCRCPLLSHSCGFLTVSISTLTKPSNNAVTHMFAKHKCKHRAFISSPGRHSESSTNPLASTSEVAGPCCSSSTQ